MQVTGPWVLGLLANLELAVVARRSRCGFFLAVVVEQANLRGNAVDCGATASLAEGAMVLDDEHAIALDPASGK